VSATTFLRRMSLPVEDKPRPLRWSGGRRWFRSTNIVDLWEYRSEEERARMASFALMCLIEAKGYILPKWPP
jgi:hypothetical protein